MPLRLKSLELQGYKTFASRTLFEFAERVTAIVGPNGSGKSNIADAVRWVLGETSLSLLRARRTEDMIFSGSEQRPRAGMAAVTITFDNSEGWLPIDFTEVTISRRAFRDGRNEYYLNGQRVRRRDVQELLAAAGLAEQSYTIIGQGLVDAALSLKAAERRTLFEEAAGIQLYRARREEALRRLETTRRNLERVQDILAELEPRLRSLERQAQRARDYEQVRADLQRLLREWYGYQWYRAQEELIEARQAWQQQESALIAARERDAELETRTTALQDRIRTWREALNVAHRDLADLHRRRERVYRDLAVADERRRALEEQQAQTRTELARQEAEVQLLEERLAAAEARVSQCTTEREEAARELEQAQAALRERRQAHAEVERTLDDLRRRLGALRGKQEHLHARLTALTQQQEHQQRELESARQALAQAEETARRARRTLNERQQTLEAARKAEAQAAAALEEARAALRERESAARAAEESHTRLQGELARLQARLDVLHQAEQALEGYASGARTLLQAVREGHLPGGQALGSALQVPPELETAIAAALGALVDGVVLPDKPAVEQALTLLERHPGRAALVPQDSQPLPSTPTPPADPDCLGLASRLVETEPALRPLVERLLGQVLVVRDRRAAARLHSQAPDMRLVTLAGEVFEPHGVVLVGQGSAGGVIRRARERRELQTRIASLTQRLTAARQTLESARHDLQTQRAVLEQAEQAQEQARTLTSQAQQAYQQAAAALEHARQQVAWHQEQIARHEQTLADVAQQAAHLSTARQNAAQSLTEIQEAIREARHRLATLPLEEFQTAVGHWETRLAVADQALRDAQARLEEVRQAAQTAKKRLTALQTRLEAQQQALAQHEQHKAELHRQENTLAEQIAALEARIRPQEESLAADEAALQALQQEAAQVREHLHRVERQHAQVQLIFARRQEALETLRERIEDDFGLVAFEYADSVEGPTPLPLEGVVEHLPRVTHISPDLEAMLKRKRAQLRRMGAINPEAQQEYEEVRQRHAFLTSQMADLREAEADIRDVIAELDALMEREFRRTFEAVAHEFREIFTRLFGGGSARLVLTEPEDLTNSGIDIEARLPGRRTQGLALLSGGERSLTAAALVFALLRVSPTPFCILDEVDAMLDEANVARFRELLEELSQHTQFVVITHNRNTVQAADVIYGITMGRDSASQVISLRLDEVSDEMAQ